MLVRRVVGPKVPICLVCIAISDIVSLSAGMESNTYFVSKTSVYCQKGKPSNDKTKNLTQIRVVPISISKK